MPVPQREARNGNQPDLRRAFDRQGHAGPDLLAISRELMERYEAALGHNNDAATEHHRLALMRKADDRGAWLVAGVSQQRNVCCLVATRGDFMSVKHSDHLPTNRQRPNTHYDTATLVDLSIEGHT